MIGQSTLDQLQGFFAARGVSIQTRVVGGVPMLNITDMWAALGCPENGRPDEWLATDRVREKLAFAAAHEGLVVAPDDSSWVHWGLGIDYAECLSNEFWLLRKRTIMEALQALRGELS